MADLADVETALVEMAAAAVYPNGTAQPSVAGMDIRIRRGWPQPAALDEDLKAGRARISVFPALGGSRDTTRYPQSWRTISTGTPTLTATISSDGLTITFGGTGGSGQNVGVLCAGTGYIKPVQATDQPTDVATGLAAQITGASSNGPILTLPSPGSVTIVAINAAQSELRRQQQRFTITAWCPTPDARDAIVAAVDFALAGLSFLALPDQPAQIRYVDTGVTDSAENALLYRRDLTYMVEYATIATQTSSPMIFPIGILQNQDGVMVTF